MNYSVGCSCRILFGPCRVPPLEVLPPQTSLCSTVLFSAPPHPSQILSSVSAWDHRALFQVPFPGYSLATAARQSAGTFIGFTVFLPSLRDHKLNAASCLGSQTIVSYILSFFFLVVLWQVNNSCRSESFMGRSGRPNSYVTCSTLSSCADHFSY